MSKVLVISTSLRAKSNSDILTKKLIQDPACDRQPHRQHHINMQQRQKQHQHCRQKVSKRKVERFFELPQQRFVDETDRILERQYRIDHECNDQRQHSGTHHDLHVLEDLRFCDAGQRHEDDTHRARDAERGPERITQDAGQRECDQDK